MDKREHWNKRYAGKALSWSGEPNALLESLLVNEPPGKGLDVGCGEGRNALWLASRGWRMDAIDFSEVGVAKASALAAEQSLDVNWITADVGRYHFAARQYDLVAIVFLHTGPEERKRWLPNVIDAVAPGGLFAYIAHDPCNITEGVGGPQDASLLPSVDEVAGHLGDFDIYRAEIHTRPVASDPGHGGAGDGCAKDSLVFARRF